MRGLQRMVDGDRYCADILTQLSSVQEALRAVGRELMRNHLRHCAAEAIRTGGPAADAMYDELVELMETAQVSARPHFALHPALCTHALVRVLPWPGCCHTCW